FTDVMAVTPRPSVIAVDVPVGLLDRPQPGGRLCDREARRLLGWRASSVFSPPCRTVLRANRYEEVRGSGLTVQAFGILPKIREVDRVMTPGRQDWVFEAHPELAFAAMAGRPMRWNKKTYEGRRERLRVLDRTLPDALGIPQEQLRQGLSVYPRRLVAVDDVIDAYALLWAAYRIAAGRAVRLPWSPRADRRGLRMEIWY
ncbi:MAG: DUF429 domain-containing protein, partial [Nitrospirales bacterium]